MNEIAVEPAEQPAQVGFGILMSLLAIGLTFNIIRGFSSVVALNAGPGAPQVDKVEAAINIGVGLLALIALVLLLRRRRAFVRAMTLYLVVNIVLSLVLYVLVLTSDVVVTNPGLVHLATFGQLVIAGLWLTYLWKSAHVRKVCVN
jgi:MYXO-CTERM domain-containing protein